MEVGGFQHRRGFGQCYQQHLGLLRVLQLHHRCCEVQMRAFHLTRDLAVISAGSIQQQQRMPGGRGVHHHKLFAGLADDAREGLKHGDFFGAGRAQVFFQHGTACGIELRALGCQHLRPVLLCHFMRVDAAHAQVFQRAAQGFHQMRCGVGGGQVHRQAALGERHRHGRREGRFADTALAHQHHQAMAVGGDVIHQRGQGVGSKQAN